jgi:drug/metabolite transporter (DMT)-like permease
MHGPGQPLDTSAAAAESQPAPAGLAGGGFAGAWRWLLNRPYLLLTLTTLSWAGNAVASRLATGHISPMALTAMRWVGVVALLFPFMARPVMEAAAVLVPIWRRILLMGALGFTAFNALMYAAAYHTTAVNMAIFQGSIPVFVLLGGLVAFGTRIGLLQVLGTALTLIGVGAIAARGDLQVLASFSFYAGDVFMLIACASYAVYTLALRDRPKLPGFVFFSALAVAALLISLPLLGWEIAAGNVIWPDLRGWAILLYVTLLPSLLSQIFFMRGVELIGPGRAGLFVNLVPVFGAILGVAILNEPFRWYHAAGLVLVLGGIWLAERKKAA